MATPALLGKAELKVARPAGDRTSFAPEEVEPPDANKRVPYQPPDAKSLSFQIGAVKFPPYTFWSNRGTTGSSQPVLGSWPGAQKPKFAPFETPVARELLKLPE